LLPEDAELQRRTRNPEHDQLEDAVYMWFTDSYSHPTAVNDETLLKKAKVLGKELNIADFSPT